MVILCSFAFQSPIVSEKLHNIITPKGKKICVIPFAGSHFNTKSLLDFGFDGDNIKIIKQDGDTLYIEKADYIYIPGGNTCKLAAELSSSIRQAVVKSVKKGAVYIGESAGACMAGEDIKYTELFDDNNAGIIDYGGLCLTDKLIICHADSKSYNDISRAKSLYPQKEVIYINNLDIVTI